MRIRPAARLALIICLVSLAPRAFAAVAAVDVSALPQETYVLAAYDDAQRFEPYVSSWTSDWQYPVSREEVATRLTADMGFLALALKSHPENQDLLLLTALIAHYAYNLDVNGSYDQAMRALNQAQTLSPADVRPLWFRASLVCQTGDSSSGFEQFLSIESAHPWNRLPIGFWDDYLECAMINGMPAHALRAADHLEALHAPPSQRRTYLVQTARNVFAPFDPGKAYPPRDAWAGGKQGEDVTFTSTTCGLQIRAHGDWIVNDLALNKGACLAYFATGPYPAAAGRMEPSILVVAQPPPNNESLQQFAQSFATKGTFRPFTPSNCPASSCIGLIGDRPGLYGKEGDGREQIVVFERDEPTYPGLLFEAPLDSSKPTTSGAVVLRPDQVPERIPGKLYYLVALDASSSIEEPADKDFGFILANLTVE
ncbi:MAG TPA: hypothetical protein VGR47_08890 [Terracidiphilus sp.]|nr:hypothetical protein [Terracidiphilus sp.]